MSYTNICKQICTNTNIKYKHTCTITQYKQWTVLTKPGPGQQCATERSGASSRHCWSQVLSLTCKLSTLGQMTPPPWVSVLVATLGLSPQSPERMQGAAASLLRNGKLLGQLFPLAILTLNSVLSTTPPSGASLCHSRYPLLRLFPLGSFAPRSAPAFPVGGLRDRNSHPARLRPGTSTQPGRWSDSGNPIEHLPFDFSLTWGSSVTLHLYRIDIEGPFSHPYFLNFTFYPKKIKGIFFI